MDSLTPQLSEALSPHILAIGILTLLVLGLVWLPELLSLLGLHSAKTDRDSPAVLARGASALIGGAAALSAAAWIAGVIVDGSADDAVDWLAPLSGRSSADATRQEVLREFSETASYPCTAELAPGPTSNAGRLDAYYVASDYLWAREDQREFLTYTDVIASLIRACALLVLLAGVTLGVGLLRLRLRQYPSLLRSTTYLATCVVPSLLLSLGCVRLWSEAERELSWKIYARFSSERFDSEGRRAPDHAAALKRFCAGRSALRAVIDAGSSGSRLYVYKINAASAPGELPTIEDVSTLCPGGRAKTAELGIDKVDSRPESVAEYLKPILNCLRQAPWGSEPTVSLLATAGMRRPSLEGRRLAILQSARAALRSSGLPIDEVRVIHGYEEGWFAWLTATYARRRLKVGGPVALLELGGSSAQLAYLRAWGGASPFTHSGRGWGMDDSWLQLETVAAESCAAPTPEGIEGQSNFEACSDAIAQHLTRSRVKTSPPPHLEVVAIGGYWHIANSFVECASAIEEHVGRDVVGPALQRSSKHEIRLNELSKLAVAAEGLCAMPPALPEDCRSSFKHPKRYCFNAAYMVTLLRDAYVLGDDRELEIVEAHSTVGGATVDPSWTLGAVIDRFKVWPDLQGPPAG